MKSGGTSLFGENEQTEKEFVTVPKEYLTDLEAKAKDADWQRGYTAGVQETLANLASALKR